MNILPFCPLPQVELGATGAPRGPGQGHQRLGRRQLPLVRQHHGDSHPHRAHFQTIPPDGQHERQLLPERDLGGAHQQQQHAHADPHHQRPELHHLAGGHELRYEGRTKMSHNRIAPSFSRPFLPKPALRNTSIHLFPVPSRC